jgi:hypothetical protein
MVNTRFFLVQFGKVELALFNHLNLLFNIIQLVAILIEFIIILQKERIVLVTANLTVFESIKTGVVRFIPDQCSVFTFVISHFGYELPVMNVLCPALASFLEWVELDDV